jgi:hypothetical protein
MLSHRDKENDPTADISQQEMHKQQSHTDPVSDTLESSKSNLNCDIMSLNESCTSSSTFMDEVILKKFKELYSKESRDLIDMIEETRLGMKNSFADFHKSKIKYTSELDEISKEKRELDRRKGKVCERSKQLFLLKQLTSIFGNVYCRKCNTARRIYQKEKRKS